MNKFTVIILSFIFFNCNSKAQNNDSKKVVNVSEKQIKLTGKQVVAELEKLDFFNLTDKIELMKVKAEFEKSFNEHNFFDGTTDDNLIYSDNRFYFIDTETLFEVGGLTQYLETVKVSFEKLNLKLNFSDEISNQTENHWTHKIKLNGKSYTAYDNNFGENDWGIAYINFIEMLNDQLRLQNSDEQFYPISSGNDGRMVLLKKKQFDFVKENYPNDKEHPQELSVWKVQYGL